MSIRVRTAVLMTLVATASPAALARAATHKPTPAQIRSAIGRAERSRKLWATINICDTRRYPHMLGIRGQMPALGFSSSLSIYIQVQYFDRAKKRFKPVPGASRLLRLGHPASGLHQSGRTFPFAPHAGLFRGTIRFEWKLAGKVLGQTTRATTSGHRDADLGNPPRFSAAKCRIR